MCDERKARSNGSRCVTLVHGAPLRCFVLSQIGYTAIEEARTQQELVSRFNEHKKKMLFEDRMFK